MEPILIKGSRFFHEKSGAQFLIKGTEYQDERLSLANSLGYSDTLEDGPSCARDIKHLKELGVNAIIVHWLRPEADHSVCMRQLQEAGIYVIAGLSRPNEQIFQTQTWDRDMFTRSLQVIENLRGFSNLLAFFVTGSPVTLPYVKGAIRDLKEHLSDQKRGKIPLGYLTLNYGKDFYQNLVCGNTTTSVDFLALNINSICSGTSQEENSLEDVVKQNGDYPVPIFVYGGRCNARKTTNIEMLQSLYTPALTKGLSGGFMFGYFDDSRNNTTGLVEIRGNGVNLRPEFSSMASQISSIQSSPTSLINYAPTVPVQSACSSIVTLPTRISVEGVPKSTTTTLPVATNLPPKPDQKLCRCMMRSLECSAEHGFHRGSEFIFRNATTKDVTNPEERQIVEQICSQNSSYCLGTQGNPATGEYGAFSVCNSTERGSWVLNQQYKARNKDAETCNSSKGVLRPVQPQPDDCKALLQQAGPLGTGMITLLSTLGNKKKSASLGPTAKIAIVVSLVALVLLILGAGLLWLRYRRKASKKQVDVQSTSSKVELPNNFIDPVGHGPYEIVGFEKLEIEGSPVTEIGSGEPPVELPTEYNQRAELEDLPAKPPPAYDFKTGD